VSDFIKTQQELRANLVSQIQEELDAAEVRGGLDAETSAKLDRIEADIRKADEAIAVAQRNEERKAEAFEAGRGVTPVVEDRSAGDIFRALAEGEMRSYSFAPETRATLVPATATVPVSFLDRVYGVARLVGPMLDVSEVIQRSSGNDLRIPVYTAFSTASSVSAGSAISESNPTFDSLLLQPSKVGFLIPVANELITDAGFDLESVLVEQAGNAIGYAVNNSMSTALTGTAGSGVTAATATAITADELIGLAYSVDGAVRRLPGTGFMANGATIGAIRKLKDTAGNYLFQPGLQGNGDSFAGFPIYENPAAENVATGKKPVLFGNFRSFKIATTGLDAATSMDYAFANDVTTYRFTYRVAGALSHAEHVKYLANP